MCSSAPCPISLKSTLLNHTSRYPGGRIQGAHLTPTPDPSRGRRTPQVPAPNHFLDRTLHRGSLSRAFITFFRHSTGFKKLKTKIWIENYTSGRSPEPKSDQKTSLEPHVGIQNQSSASPQHLLGASPRPKLVSGRLSPLFGSSGAASRTSQNLDFH